MPTKIKRVSIPIYFGYLRIVIATDFNKAAKKVKYECGEDLSFYAAFVYPDHTKKKIARYTIFLKPKASHSSIAHEAVHIVNNIFKDRKMGLDVYNDEAQAYLTGWVAGEVYKALKKAR